MDLVAYKIEIAGELYKTFQMIFDRNQTRGRGRCNQENGFDSARGDKHVVGDHNILSAADIPATLQILIPDESVTDDPRAVSLDPLACLSNTQFSLWKTGCLGTRLIYISCAL